MSSEKSVVTPSYSRGPSPRYILTSYFGQAHPISGNRCPWLSIINCFPSPVPYRSDILCDGDHCIFIFTRSGHDQTDDRWNNNVQNLLLAAGTMAMASSCCPSHIKYCMDPSYSRIESIRTWFRFATLHGRRICGILPEDDVSCQSPQSMRLWPALCDTRSRKDPAIIDVHPVSSFYYRILPRPFEIRSTKSLNSIS